MSESDWRIYYFDGMAPFVVTPEECAWDDLPVEGVLRVESGASYSQGHDHYWLNDDGSIGYADHHDYGAEGWPVVGCELPDDRLILNGRLVPDDVAREMGLL